METLLKKLSPLMITATLLVVAGLAQGQSAYFPDRHDWATQSPAEAGFDEALLQAAVDFATKNETPYPKDISKTLPIAIAGEPFNTPVGPTKTRTAQNGIILRNGFIVAEWGDTTRADMTFSVTKSYLSTIAGLALDAGLIADVHDPVHQYVQDGTFDAEHNRKITWHMLLNQTSDWEGTLWGKPDWADRWEGSMPERREPGTHWEYNDVRVNVLAYALLQVWREPLPRVLKKRIMDPIGASATWRWHGYENSWVEIDGLRMQSVSGGGHWGGGMFISTRDHARFGQLFLRRGMWNGQRLLSEDWMDRIVTPTDAKPTYGYMNWEPNTNQQVHETVPEDHFFCHGAGTNMIWVAPEEEMVVVVRWMEDGAIDEFMGKVMEALD